MASQRGRRSLRVIDAYVGRALVGIVGAVRTRHARPAELRRIGLLKTAAVGDLVLLSAIAHDLHAALPEASLFLVAGGDNAPVASLFPDWTTVRIDVARPVRAVRRLRSLRLDCLLDFGSWPRIDAVLAACSGARFTAGFSKQGQHRHFAYDRAVEHSHQVHELENYRQLAAVLGVESRSLPRFEPPVVSRAHVATARYVVFHPWPGGFRSELREWPQDRWLSLGRHLATLGVAVVITGAPADRDRSERLRAALAAQGVEARSVAGDTDWQDLQGVLTGAAAIVSVNTGVAHFAAALGCRIICLNGPTSALRWGPVGENAVSINSSFEGCGYLDLGFEYAGHREDCMEGISVDEVVKTVDRSLGLV